MILVMQSRGKAQEALEWTHGVLERLGLTLNEKKTSIRDARQGDSIFWDTHSARTLTRATAIGISDTARRGRA
jgi:hypothetical protein